MDIETGHFNMPARLLAETLVAAYVRNENETNGEYFREILQVTGKVSNAARNSEGVVPVNLDGSDSQPITFILL